MKLKNTVSGVELDLVSNDWTLIPDRQPERWVDVTEHICAQDKIGDCCIAYDYFNQIAWTKTGYRLRKVQTFEDDQGNARGSRHPFWAFVVEKKEPS